MIELKKNRECDWANCTDIKMVWSLQRMLWLNPICGQSHTMITMTSFIAQLPSAGVFVNEEVQ
jgi:hypothetical protein